nr:hypothetical protein [Tanacetum cinerariifolium]
MNYAQVPAGTNSNDFAGKGASFDAGQSSMETGPSQDYILMPLGKDNSLFDSSSQASDGHNKDKNGPSQASESANQKRPNAESKDARIFDDAYDDKDKGAKADYNNLETGHRQEEGIDNDEVFAPIARIEAIKLFFAYASFMDFTVYQLDVKSAFLYGTIKEEVYVSQPLGFVDQEFPDRVYKVEKALYGLHQAPRACVKSASTPMETHKPLSKDAARIDVNVHLYRYLKSQPTLGLWYPKDSPLGLIAYSDSDYVGASLDRKSTTGEYITASNYYGQVLWLQNQLLGYGYNFMQTKIHVDNESAIYVMKNPIYHSKTKHIEIRHHFIRDSYKKRLIEMVKIHTDYNVVYLLTKAFDVTSTMAPAIICLANNQNFNFSKNILDNLKKNLEAGVPFYMFPRFIYVFVNHQIGDMSHHKGIYVNPSLTKKVFANMKRVGTWFFGAVTSLFGTMMVQAVEEVGDLPSAVQVTPILDAPSSSQSQRKHKPRRKERKETKVSPTELPIEDHVTTTSNDPLPSGKDLMQLKELMVLCTNLSNKVLDLENEVIEMNSSHKAKIAELDSRVEKLEEENRSLTKELKSFNTKGRKIADIDADAEVNLENVYNLDMAYEETVLSMQDLTDADGKEVAKEVVEVITTAKIVVDEMDMKTTFLNGPLKEEVYVAQPDGFIDPDHPKEFTV